MRGRAPFVTYEDDPLVAFRRAAHMPGLSAGPRRLAGSSKRRVPTRRNWDGKPRFTPKRLIIAGAILLAVGGGTPQLLAGCILFGLPGGNHLTFPPLIAQQEFRHADVATVVALYVAISQGAMAFGPAAFGLLYDATGGYVLPFTLAAIADATAALILLGGRKASR